MKKYQPSLKIDRLPGESARDFVRRVADDPRCLPDQKQSLEQDLRYGTAAFDECLRAIWMERPPIEVADSSAGASRDG